MCIFVAEPHSRQETGSLWGVPFAVTGRWTGHGYVRQTAYRLFMKKILQARKYGEQLTCGVF